MSGGAKTLILPNAQKSGLRPACHLLGPLQVVCWHRTEKAFPAEQQFVASAQSHAILAMVGSSGGRFAGRHGLMSPPEFPTLAGVTASTAKRCYKKSSCLRNTDGG